MKRLLLYLSCFLLVGGSGVTLQSCETWEVPSEQTLSINQGLVAYLPFTKGSLKDSIRADEHRQVDNTPIWGGATKPKYKNGFSDVKNSADSAIYFDGTGDYFTLKDNESLQFKNNSFSISLWIKPDIDKLIDPAIEKPAMQIFHKSTYKNNGNESYSAMIRTVLTYVSTVPINRTLSVILNIKMDDAEKNISSCTLSGPGWQNAQATLNPSVLIDASWHHLVFSYNKDHLFIYVDGNLLDFQKLDGGRIQSCPGGDLRFGMQVEGSYIEDNKVIALTNFFKGTMDEIRIYNRQLNENEVKSLFALRSYAP